MDCVPLPASGAPEGLRGTAFDVFGYTAERREERRLIADYEPLVEHVLHRLHPGNDGQAIALAILPEQVRGFGHIKEQAIAKMRTEQARLLGPFRCEAHARRFGATCALLASADAGDVTGQNLLIAGGRPRQAIAVAE